MAKKITNNGLEIIRKRLGVDARTDPTVQQWSDPYRVAQLIYDARTEAGLTQTELAERVGATQSVISQLENADYDGRSLSPCCVVLHRQ